MWFSIETGGAAGKRGQRGRNWLLASSLAGNSLAPSAAKGFYNGRWQCGLASDALYVVSIGSNDVSFRGRTLEQADAVAGLALSTRAGL